MRRKEEIAGNFDWISILLYLILVFIGWMTIYSSVYVDETSSIFDMKSTSGKQLQWIISSFVFIFIILLFNAKFFSTFAYFIYGALLVFLFGVIFFGVEIKGQQNWIRIGSFQMQPSELAKFATSLALAKYVSGLNVDVRKWRDKLYAFGIIGLPMLIILAQGDTGSAIVFVVLVLPLFREGLEPIFLIAGTYLIIISVLALLIPFWILFAIYFSIALIVAYLFRKTKNLLIVIAIVLSATLIYTAGVHYIFEKLPAHQKVRIKVTLGLENNKKYTWNIDQSKIAIGSGGFKGKGYLQGTQTKLSFVPEQSTDFIFSALGEEFGFVGSITLIGIFMLLFFRLIFLAERQRSKFSRIYGYCVLSILFFHFLINIGMVIGIAPVIGIPLPFISYGGSSLLAFTVLVFVFIKLDSQRMDVLR